MAAKGPDLKPGQMVPGTKYCVVRQIGAGGMGVVYQVVKAPSIQGVLKLMSSDLTAHEEFRTRFLDEVRVLAQIDHPNIVKVFDYDTLPDGTPFYVMELLHGRTVRDVLATMSTFPPRVAFEVTRQLCEALHCAHTHDIPVVHRDIKPENIFLHAPRHGEPQVKLIDFGVVAIADRQHDGAFVGTWKYAAPEQIRGERATPATDLYAVGLVLYEMLCGQGPFEHLESGSLVSQAHLREIPAPVSKFAPWVPPSIVELISSALAKAPRQRPRDAYAFAERLYELEWANDGKDPSDRTAEGPLSRILSTAGGNGKPPSKNLVATPPKDRLGNVPVIGVPQEVRHGGPTIKGIGGGTQELTSPGEDTLLAGLDGRPDIVPPSKKAPGKKTPRTPPVEVAKVEAPTLDAPPSAPKLANAGAGAGGDTNADFGDGTTRKLTSGASARTYESDTLGAQESDARRAPRRAGKLALPIALALFAVIAVVSFAAYRVRAPAAQAGSPPASDPSVPVVTAPAGEETSATTTPPPGASEVASPEPSTSTATPVAKVPTAAPRAGKPATVSTRVVTPPSPPASSLGSMPPAATPSPSHPEVPKKPAPSPSSKDESFLRGL